MYIANATGCSSIVAPFAGAWIEIAVPLLLMAVFASLPLRERGLKYNKPQLSDSDIMSLPLRERGLKYNKERYDAGKRLSLPLRERGLK